MRTDGTVQLMYHMFTEHGVPPSVVYNMPEGERYLCSIFFHAEMEVRVDEQ